MGIMGIYARTSVETDGTSIEQQKKLGIQFCDKNGFEYQIYEDVGKSGFKIEDDENPFKNRQGLTRLIDDIEKKIIDKIWVYEHSRLSRNRQSSFVLDRIFLKYKITVYERDKQYDLNDPQNQMIQGILTEISQYERHLITNRITRGVHDSINRGIKGYREFYGYKKGGKGDKYMKWIPVDSEIENIRYSYQEYLKGKSIYIIIKEIYGKFAEKQRMILSQKWTRILKHFENTGYSLNTDGLEIYNKFKKYEIESIKELNNKKYYVKSANFPVKIISIEKWIKVVEKLQEHKIVYKDKMRKTDTEMATGIIQCPYCELRYYYVDNNDFHYYRHYSKNSCGQRPKSIMVEKINKLMEVFFFYFYLVYDDTKILIEESQKILKLNSLEVKDKIKNVESENRRLQKQIDRFQNIYEETNDNELLKLTLKKESELNMKLENNSSIITKLKLELEELNNKFKEDELELTYYNVKETIINFFEKLTAEEKRLSLVKIIKNCQLFGKYLVIDTGELLFVFNINDNYKLPETIFNEFKNDKYFKDNFLNSNSLLNHEGEYTDYIQKFFDTPIDKARNKYTQKQIDKIQKDILLWLIIRRLGDDIIIQEYYLKTAKILIENKLQELKIGYNLGNIDKLISFTEDI